MNKWTATAMVIAVLNVSPASAQPARAPEEQSVDVQGPAEGGADVVEMHPEPRPQPRPVPRPAAAAPGSDALRRGASSAGEAGLRALVAVEVRAGAARVLSNGRPLTLRPGDSIGGDVVRRVEPNRILLARPEGDGREATVIVTFDAQKRARVLVFRTKDDTAVEVPSLR